MPVRSPRNVILVTSPSAGGKTTYIRELDSILRPYGEITHISDAHFIAQAVGRDHVETKGVHHRHPPIIKLPDGSTINIYDLYRIQEAENGGHRHIANDFPFPYPFPLTVTSNQIRDWMFAEYWYEVSNASTEGFVIAELAGGANGHGKSSDYGHADYSYRAMAENFRQGVYPPGALLRISHVIHTETDYGRRLERTRSDSTPDVTTIFRDDDFAMFEPLLIEHGAHVTTIDNNRQKDSPRIQDELWNSLGRMHGIEQVSHGRVEGA